jgi:F-type H+-transporting ATPase subunit delta
MATNQSDPVARVYAVALYESARDSGAVGDVQQGLALLIEAWNDRVFRDFFTSPRVPRPVKIKGMEAALQGRVAPQVLNFVKVLIAKGREPQFDNIVSAFHIYRDQAENRVHAWVQSGGAMQDAEVESIKRQLSVISGGKDVVLHYEHQPELIGGAKIRLGDRLIDNTLRTRLKHLAQSMGAQSQ